MNEAGSVFEYLYRDAGNYKSWGTILLRGACSPEAVTVLRKSLDCGEFFVAEQVGIPVLHHQLAAFSGGPTADDHAFHEFYALRDAMPEEVANMRVWGDLSALLDSFRKANGHWKCALSPHARCGR